MKSALNDQNMNLYLRVYNHYRELILNGKLPPGSRLPSLRRCAAELQISRTTAETAYMCLAAEGYIISRPQSGFYVTEIAVRPPAPGYSAASFPDDTPDIRYDFASSQVDRASFNFDLWRRYVKSALRQDDRLVSYGDPQGEYELREAICRYLSNTRNTICTPDSIIIGAGAQSLLHILCPLLSERKRIRFFNREFEQGTAVFEDHGFSIQQADSLTADLLYVTPSQMTRWGDVMPVTDRLDLMKKCSQENTLIIEDDYNSEFRYFNRPVPSLQGLSGGRGVIYLSTFSRLLLPSIRISFMILPPDILEHYRKRGRLYNQTASKVEQIALCQFIRDGHLESQIKKSRKLYMSKSDMLCREIRHVFGDSAIPHPSEAGFLIRAEFRSALSSSKLAAKARRHGIAVIPVDSPGNYPQLLLSCASLETDCYHEALLYLKESLGL